MLRLESPQGTIQYGLRREVLEGEIEEPDELLRQLDAVTVEDVQRVARDLFDGDAALPRARRAVRRPRALREAPAKRLAAGLDTPVRGLSSVRGRLGEWGHRPGGRDARGDSRGSAADARTGASSSSSRSCCRSSSSAARSSSTSATGGERASGRRSPPTRARSRRRRSCRRRTRTSRLHRSRPARTTTCSPTCPDQSRPEPRAAAPRPLACGRPTRATRTCVEATVRMRCGTFFGRIVGSDYDRGRAPRGRGAARRARRRWRSSPAALTAHDRRLCVRRGRINITGHVHSNGEFTVNGSTTGPRGRARAERSRRGTARRDRVPTVRPRRRGRTVDEGDWLPCDGHELQWPDWFIRPTSAGTARAELARSGARTRARRSRSTQRISRSSEPASRSPPIRQARLDDHPDRHVLRDEPSRSAATDHSGTITASRATRSRSTATASGLHAVRGQRVLFFTVPNSNSDPSTTVRTTLGDFSPTDIRRTHRAALAGERTIELNGERLHVGRDHLQPVRQGARSTTRTITVGRVGTCVGHDLRLPGRRSTASEFNMIGTEDFAGTSHSRSSNSAT